MSAAGMPGAATTAGERSWRDATAQISFDNTMMELSTGRGDLGVLLRAVATVTSLIGPHVGAV